eukprot:TRINITY_DN7408_c0_g1_i1.p1 TRINITY_DN7408_c0_g1~~TRINITY_DN7408_c0_g1_i1.p1  ORF type:complete len:400 (-),score=36.10 TRINITY_DN7408_c0_g1_i1:307-1506(-)
MVYQAKILYFSLLAIGSWRLLIRKTNITERLELPNFLQQPLHIYMLIYFMLGTLLFNSLHQTHTLMRVTHYLDPFTFHVPPDMPADEQDFPRWLATLSIWVPVASVLTFVVSVVHSAVHARMIAGKDIKECTSHDRTILVIALPPVYGAMAYKSVLRMWGLLTGGGVLHDVPGYDTMDWNTLKSYTMDAYESNYDTADLYEAWALYLFAMLCLKQVRVSVKKAAQGHGADQLAHTVTSLTLQGVTSFVVVCALQATYRTVLTIYVSVTKDTHLPGLQPYLTGAGLIASSAAIGNVITVESQLHSLLENFKPGPKFWSTKVLVSIAFMQKACLSVAAYFLDGHFTEMQQNLLFSSLICYEVLGVSVFHVYAWYPNEAWLSDLNDHSHNSDHTEPFLSHST